MSLTTEVGSITAAESEDSEPGEPLRGARAGSYRVLGRIGSGGMADVYEAEHERLGSLVAIKFLRAQTGTVARATGRFRGEARRMAALRSDHVVRVFDYGELPNGAPYLVMERLFGRDLRALLREHGPLPVRRAVKLALDACRGLSVAHAAGLVHRDLKPANLFVEQTTEAAERCKILDFGVAKWAESDTTRPGSLLGTVCYMAPEQLENAAAVTPAADVYALGAILYEMLAGVPAHQGATPQAAIFDVLQREPASLSTLRSVPTALEAIIRRALSRDATKRFESVNAMALALRPFASAGPQLPGMPDGAAETLAEGSSGAEGEATREGPRRGLGLALVFVGIGAACGWLLHDAQMKGRTPQVEAAPPLPTASSPTAAAPSSVQVTEVAPRFASSPPIASRVPPSPSALRPNPGVRRAARPGARTGVGGAPSAPRYDPRDPYE